MADFDKVRRNVKRMVDASASEDDIDSYLGTEGITADQLRSAPKGGQTVLDRARAAHDAAPKKEGIYGAIDDTLTKVFRPINKALQPVADYADRGINSSLMGGRDEISAGIQAAGETLLDPLGQKSIGQRYSERLAEARAERDRVNAATEGPLGTTMDVVGGFGAFGPGRVAAAAAAEALPLAPTTWRQGLSRMASEKMAMAPQLAKTGALFGGANAMLSTDGSSDPNATIGDHAAKRLGAVPSGMMEGAIGSLLIGNALHTGLGVRDIARARKVDRIQRQQLGALDWQAEGMTAPGYTITESPSARATAQGLSDSVLGGSIRNDAAARTSQLESRAQQAIREHTSGVPSSEMGEQIQQSLQRNLHEYTIPNRTIQAMPNAELERMTGPVTNGGFRPPRPTVDPVTPRDVPTITPEQFSSEGLPNRVPPVEPQFTPPSRREFGDYSPDLQVRDMDLQIRAQNFNNKYNTGESKNFREVPSQPPTLRQEIEANAIANRHDALLAKHAEKFPELSQDSRSYNSPYLDAAIRRDPSLARDIQRMASLRERYGQLQEELRPMREEHAALWNDRKKLAADKESYGDEAFKKKAHDAYAKAQAEAQAETLRRNAAAETAHRREQARLEAEGQTRAAQQAADDAYYEDLSRSSNGFSVGRTRETYPTEFAAAYERVNRETPQIQRNILGSSNEPRQTATESLLYDFAATARRQNQAAGYRNGKLFGVDGSVMHPGVSRYLERNLGSDISGQLQAYAQRRASGGFNPGIDGVRDLRTAVRRAAQEAERGTIPGDTRTTDAAMLRRLEGALTEDMHTFQAQQGPQGQRSSAMMRGVDQQYAQFAEDVRRPLSRFYGDRVTPVDAMNRLARAAQGGDLRTLNAFMRVMNEKDSPARAAASIVAHLTDGAGDIGSFLRGYSSIPADSRTALFRGAEAQALRARLDNLQRLMTQLEPYQTPIARGGGIDFSRRSNLMLGVGAITHIYGTLFAAGGLAMTARFMSSPRYISWLTTLPRPSGRGMSTPDGIAAVARLRAIAQSDSDRERGQSVLNAVGDIVLPTGAKAAPLTPAVRARIEPITSKVIFAGEGSKTADRGKLEEAKRMDAAPDKPDTWKVTGWAKGDDGKWRYEIDDSAAKIGDQARKLISDTSKTDTAGAGISLPLSFVINHAELFSAYPKLKNMPVEIFSEKSYPALKGIWGFMDPKTNKIVINANKAAEDNTDLLHTVLHEAQHKLQLDEKFAYGRSLKGIVGYDERPGEAEAFDTGRRRTMNAAQRRNLPPDIIRNAKRMEWPTETDALQNAARRK